MGAGKGMISRNWQTLWEAGVYSARVVAQRRGLAVKDLASKGNIAAEDGEDALPGQELA